MTSSSPRQRSHWLAQTLVPLALLVASVHSECVSLKDSVACPSFSQYAVDTAVAAETNLMTEIGIKMNNFTDIKSFDAAIIGATGFYTSPSCTGYSSATRIRYQDSILCTILVQDDKSEKCTKDVPNMCVSSCTLYANELKSLLAKTCPSDSESQKRLDSLNSICTGKSESWTGLQDSSSTCVDATTNEKDTCGKFSQSCLHTSFHSIPFHSFSFPSHRMLIERECCSAWSLEC